MERIYICSLIVLAMCFAYAILRILQLKRDLRSASKQCGDILQQNTNRMVHSKSLDKDVCHLIETFNIYLKEMNDWKANTLREEMEMRNVITNLAHDVRTPVTSLMGYAKLLREEITDPKQTEYLRVIIARSETLRNLVEELFSYSLVMEQTEYNFNKENINNIIEESILMFYNDIQEKSISLTLDLVEEPVYVSVDRVALKRVFMNIISNAIKYSSDELVIHQEGRRIIFSNTVNNLDEIDVKKIFDRFFTVAKNRKQGSTGLGLTIAKKLVTDMGGEITASLHGDLLKIEVYFGGEHE